MTKRERTTETIKKSKKNAKNEQTTNDSQRKQ